MSVKTCTTAGKNFPTYKCAGMSFPTKTGTAESDTYEVRVENQSSQPWRFFLYQRPPKNAQTLVWMATPYNIGVGDQHTFSWTDTYQFAWADTGPLEYGGIFNAGGFKKADPQNNNLTHFTFQDTTPSLSESTTGGPPGSLVIKDGPYVPSNQFSVGIAMSNQAISALNAGPNLTHIFTPSEPPSYYVCASDAVTEGEVLYIPIIGTKAITFTASEELIFPANVFALTATLTDENLWKI